MDKDWKNSLRERFSDYSVPEPEGLWEGIEQGLSEKPRRNRTPLWWGSGLAAAAAVTLLLFLHPASQVQPEEDVPALASIALKEPLAVPMPDTLSEQEPAPVPVAVLSRHTLVAEADPVILPTLSPDVPEKADTLQVSDTKEVTAHEQPAATTSSTPVPQVLRPLDADFPEVEKPKLDRPVTVRVYQSVGMSAGEQSQGFGMARTGAFPTRSTWDQSTMDRQGLVRMLSSNQASTYEAHHAAPVRWGVMVAFPLTRRISLVSGLNWTRLRSTFEESTASTRSEIRQDLGYLGIPLRLEGGYHLWKGLWLHPGFGMMVEKGLSASSTKDFYVRGQLEESHSFRPSTGGLLYSVGGGVEWEYRLTQTVGLYVEPKIEIHISNGNDLETAYTERPVNAALSFGVRFNFDK